MIRHQEYQVSEARMPDSQKTWFQLPDDLHSVASGLVSRFERALGIVASLSFRGQTLTILVPLNVPLHLVGFPDCFKSSPHNISSGLYTLPAELDYLECGQASVLPLEHLLTLCALQS